MLRNLVVDGFLWLASAALLVVIVVNSLAPQQPRLPLFPLADKLWHAAAYALLTFVLLLAAVWRPGRGRGATDAASVLVVAVVALSAAVEVAQLVMTETREASVLDVAANTVGAVGAAVGWSGLRKALSCDQ